MYLVSAKRRQTWGEYRYYNPSRFIEEIPHNLMESFESEGYSRGGSTFRSAVSKAKESYAKSDSDGYIKPSTGFGANFVAPQRKGLASGGGTKSYSKPAASNRTPQRTIIVKSAINKKREEEKIAAFFKDNAIKRMAEERRQRLAAEKEEAERREEQRKAAQTLTDVFDVGQRVSMSRWV